MQCRHKYRRPTELTNQLVPIRKGFISFGAMKVTEEQDSDVLSTNHFVTLYLPIEVPLGVVRSSCKEAQLRFVFPAVLSESTCVEGI